MTSLHGLKVKKKNILRQLKKCYSSRFDLSQQIIQLEGAKANIDALIVMKRGKK